MIGVREKIIVQIYAELYMIFTGQQNYLLKFTMVFAENSVTCAQTY